MSVAGPDPSLGDRLRLIVITDAELADPRALVDVVRAAVGAGAPAIQLRDKSAGAGRLFEIGRELLPVTRGAGALLLVNDRLDVALALGADGVHLGPDDVPVAEASRAAAVAVERGTVPPGFLIGTSTDDPDEARALVEAGAHYIGCGAVYPTSTKPDAGRAIGLEGLDAVARAVSVPVVAIGGITPARSAAIATSTRAAGVAVIRAVMGADDPVAAVRGLLAPWPHGPRA